MEPQRTWGAFGVEGDLRPTPTERGAYPDFYAGVVASLRESAPPPVDPETAADTIAVLEAARRSAEHRTTVVVPARPVP